MAEEDKAGSEETPEGADEQTPETEEKETPETEEKETPETAEKEAVEEKSAKKAGDQKAAGEKPLDKMTVKELREIGKETSGITGVSGMNKEELLSAIKKARGIEDKVAKQKDVSVREIKQKIKALKLKRKEALAARDKKTAAICRRRISRLKKKTRRAA